MTRSVWARGGTATLAAVLLLAGLALAEVRVVVVSGAPAPGGNGIFTSVGLTSPALNDSGHAAFAAQLVGSSSALDDSGIFVGDGITLSQVVREGQAVPGGGTFGLSRRGSGARSRPPRSTAPDRSCSRASSSSRAERRVGGSS